MRSRRPIVDELLVILNRLDDTIAINWYLFIPVTVLNRISLKQYSFIRNVCNILANCV